MYDLAVLRLNNFKNTFSDSLFWNDTSKYLSKKYYVFPCNVMFFK